LRLLNPCGGEYSFLKEDSSRKERYYIHLRDSSGLGTLVPLEANSGICRENIKWHGDREPENSGPSSNYWRYLNKFRNIGHADRPVPEYVYKGYSIIMNPSFSFISHLLGFKRAFP
jgi:hypothetical protein